uniref:Protein kinase domain-containing protein n=1 Tax=viral metagenome TaxID=1070528 RepID=A0A6C0BQY1_9ZZZZ
MRLLQVLSKSQLSKVELFQDGNVKVIKKSCRLFGQHEKELRLLQLLNHVQIYGCGHDQHDGFYILMEYVEGGDYLECVSNRNKCFNMWEAMHIIYQVLHDLQYLRDVGYFHGDVTLENILLHRTKGAILHDFEYCESLEVPLPISKRGKPHYVAPELSKPQLQGLQYDVCACDIYSLGKCLLYLCFKDMRVQDLNLAPDALQVLLRGMLNEHWEQRFTLDTCMEYIERLSEPQRFYLVPASQICLSK